MRHDEHTATGDRAYEGHDAVGWASDDRAHRSREVDAAMARQPVMDGRIEHCEHGARLDRPEPGAGNDALARGGVCTARWFAGRPEDQHGRREHCRSAVPERGPMR